MHDHSFWLMIGTECCFDCKVVQTVGKSAFTCEIVLYFVI